MLQRGHFLSEQICNVAHAGEVIGASEVGCVPLEHAGSNWSTLNWHEFFESNDHTVPLLPYTCVRQT